MHVTEVMFVQLNSIRLLTFNKMSFWDCDFSFSYVKFHFLASEISLKYCSKLVNLRIAQRKFFEISPDKS